MLNNMSISHFYVVVLALALRNCLGLKNSDKSDLGEVVNKTVSYKRFYIEPEPHYTFAVYSKTSAAYNVSDPVEFLVREEGLIRQWQIPSHRFPAANFSKLTLCPPSKKYIDVVLPANPDRYSFVLKKVPYDIKPGENCSDIQISPTAPVVFRFELLGTTSYLLTIKNVTEAVCTLGTSTSFRTLTSLNI